MTQTINTKPDTLTSGHFYDHLTKQSDNGIVIALAYAEYKRVKILTLESHKQKLAIEKDLQKNVKRKPKKDSLDSIMKRWQADECHKIDLYMSIAIAKYDKAFQIMLDDSVSSMDLRHSNFRKEVGVFCPQKKESKFPYFRSTLTSVFGWIISLGISFFMFALFSEKGLIGTISHLLTIYNKP